eukprot:15453209-Alexandrium_andersonii.AAC.1
MAGLGGDHASHQERALHTWLSGLFGVVRELDHITLHLATGDDNTVRPVKWPVLSIHKMAHALWRAGADQWQVSMLGEGGAAGVAEYWAHALNEDWTNDFPELRAAGHPASEFLPVYVHIDGAEVHTNSEMTIWSWRWRAVTRGGLEHPLRATWRRGQSGRSRVAFARARCRLPRGVRGQLGPALTSTIASSPCCAFQPNSWGLARPARRAICVPLVSEPPRTPSKLARCGGPQ